MGTKMTKDKKPGVFKRAGSWLYHTLADDGVENHDDRDIFQVIADSVMGPTPGRKVARSATAAGATAAIGGIFTGSATLITIGGVTFIVGGVAEGVQWYKGRKVTDAPKVSCTDEQAVEAAGMEQAAKATSSLHAVLKSVATGEIFQLSERKFEQLFSRAQAQTPMNQKDQLIYNSIVRLAERDGLVTVAS